MLPPLPLHVVDVTVKATVIVTTVTASEESNAKKALDDNEPTKIIEFKSHKLVMEHSRSIDIHIDAASPSLPISVLWETVCEIVLSAYGTTNPLCARLGQGFTLWNLQLAHDAGGSLVKTKHYLPFWSDGNVVIGRQTVVPLITRCCLMNIVQPPNLLQFLLFTDCRQ